MKMKLKVLGKPRKPPKGTDKPSYIEEESFPNVRLGSHRVPVIKDLKPGDKCTLMFEAEVTGTRKRETYEHGPEGTIFADFKLKKGDVHPADGKKDGKDYKSYEHAMHDGVAEGEEHEARKKLSSKMTEV